MAVKDWLENVLLVVGVFPGVALVTETCSIIEKRLYVLAFGERQDRERGVHTDCGLEWNWVGY